MCHFIVILLYSLFCIGREAYYTLMEKDNKLEENHLEAHLSLLFSLFLTTSATTYWLFDGTFKRFEELIVSDNLWALMLLLSYSITSTTRHLRKERLNEDYVLDIHKETKLTYFKKKK